MKSTRDSLGSLSEPQAHTGDESGKRPTGLERDVAQGLIRAEMLLGSTAGSRVAGSERIQTESDFSRLLAEARHSICVALTGTSHFDQLLLRLVTMIDGPARTRIFCTAQVLDGLAPAELGKLKSCRDVRISGSGLCGVLTVDGRAALVHVRGRAPDEEGIAVVDDPAAVRTLEMLCANAWSRGHDLTCHLRITQHRTEHMRNILGLLKSGCTDADAARELNMPLRTYRRHVAKIMRELRATSRFQAGVKAAGLDLLRN